MLGSNTLKKEIFQEMSFHSKTFSLFVKTHPYQIFLIFEVLLVYQLIVILI